MQIRLKFQSESNKSFFVLNLRMGISDTDAVSRPLTSCFTNHNMQIRLKFRCLFTGYKRQVSVPLQGNGVELIF
jgi:hypothetical protein